MKKKSSNATTNVDPKPRLQLARAVLVYQGHIANVFTVVGSNILPAGRRCIRLCQGTYEQCVWYACGLGRAGVRVTTAACLTNGDAALADWTEDWQHCANRVKMINLDICDCVTRI